MATENSFLGRLSAWVQNLRTPLLGHFGNSLDNESLESIEMTVFTCESNENTETVTVDDEISNPLVMQQSNMESFVTIDQTFSNSNVFDHMPPLNAGNSSKELFSDTVGTSQLTTRTQTGTYCTAPVPMQAISASVCSSVNSREYLNTGMSNQQTPVVTPWPYHLGRQNYVDHVPVPNWSPSNIESMSEAITANIRSAPSNTPYYDDYRHKGHNTSVPKHPVVPLPQYHDVLPPKPDHRVQQNSCSGSQITSSQTTYNGRDWYTGLHTIPAGTPFQFVSASPHHNSKKSRHREKEPQTFDGKTDVIDYLQYFLKLAKLNSWNYQTAGLQLATSLNDDAVEILTDLSTEKSEDLNSLMKALIRKYSPPGRELQYANDLMNRSWNKGSESVTEFAHNLCKLARKAYPVDGIPEYLMIDLFKRGLQLVPSMQMQLHLTDPKTFDEAVNIAVIMESFVTQTDNSRQNGCHSFTDIDNEHDIHVSENEALEHYEIFNEFLEWKKKKRKKEKKAQITWQIAVDTARKMVTTSKTVQD